MKNFICHKFVNRKTQQAVNLMVTQLDISFLDEILKLQQHVMNFMTNKDLYVGLTNDEIIYILQKNGVILGAFDGESLIATYAILIPGSLNCNLGYDLNIAPKELPNVAHIEALFVNPEYRGFSISKALGQHSMQLISKMMDLKYLCATISPYNYPSLSHAFYLGLRVKDVKYKYDGVLRYILVKDYTNDSMIDCTSLVRINVNDIEFQKKLFLDGYIGTNSVLIDDQRHIEFYKYK